MSINKRLVTNTGLNLAGYAYLFVASFIAIPSILHSLGTAQMGEYLLLVGLPILLSVFDLGLVSATIFYLSRNPSDKQSWSTSLAALLTGSLVLAVVSFFVVSHIFGLPGLALPVMALTFVTILSEVFLLPAQVTQNYLFYNTRTVIVGTSATLLAALILSLSPVIVSALWLQVAAHLLTIVLSVYYYRSWYQTLPRPSKTSLTKLLKYGLTSWVTQVTGQIQSYAGKFFVSRLISASAVTPLGIAQSLVAKLSGAIITSVKALFPAASALSASHETPRIKKIFLLAESFILVIALGGIVINRYLGLPLLVWWLGDHSVALATYQIFSILLIYFVSSGLTVVPSMLINGLGFPALPSFFAVTTVVVELLFLIYLTPKYGPLGPAYAATIASLVNTPPFLYLVWRRLK